MNEPTRKVGRLAMRQEGDNWVAYYATTDTMEGAIFLGSIHIGAINKNADRKRAFMDMMRDVVTDLIEGEFGIRPTWGGPERAPEHERSGRG